MQKQSERSKTGAGEGPGTRLTPLPCLAWFARSSHLGEVGHETTSNSIVRTAPRSVKHGYKRYKHVHMCSTNQASSFNKSCNSALSSNISVNSRSTFLLLSDLCSLSFSLFPTLCKCGFLPSLSNPMFPCCS